jgi:hypothetical protein
MHIEHLCYFVSKFDYYEITMGTSHTQNGQVGTWEHYKKYWNKVKTYEACPPGTWSVQDAKYNAGAGYEPYAPVASTAFTPGNADYRDYTNPRSANCQKCVPGKYNTKQTMNEHCPICELGKISNYESTIGVYECKNCPAGWFSNPQPNDWRLIEYNGNGSPMPAANTIGTVGILCIQCQTNQKSYYSLEKSERCTLCPKGKFGTANMLKDAANTGNGCMNCPKGKDTMNALGKLGCTDCVPGQYGPHEGLPDCHHCHPGKYTILSQASADVSANMQGRSTCTNCPNGWSTKGHWSRSRCWKCDPGKWAHVGYSLCKHCGIGRYSEEGWTDCAVCQVGKHMQHHGNSVCFNCPVGKWQPDTGTAWCRECDLGKHQDQVMKTICKSCPVGKIADEIGLVTCPNCPTGWWMDETGAGNPDEAPFHAFCKKCDLGKHQDNEGTTVCKNCATGRVMPRLEAVHCDRCTRGMYMDETGKEVCKQCDLGKLAPDQERVTCIDCSTGRYTDQKQQWRCKVCGVGRFANKGTADPAPGINAGADHCAACAKGKDNPSLEKTVCVDCVLGKFAETKGMVNCEQCGVGTYMGATGKSQCTNCENGKHINVLGKSRCTDCLDGYYSLSGYPNCALCPQGRFSVSGATNTQNSNCEACGVGKYSEADERPVGACKQCEIGRYLNSQGQIECKNCQVGRYMDSWAADQGTTCKLCPAGWTEDTPTPGGEKGVDRVVCKRCLAGKFTNSAGEEHCSDCDPHYYSAQTASRCTRCAAGQVALRGSSYCEACPSGKISPSGDPFFVGMLGFLGESNEECTGPGWKDCMCKTCDPGKYAATGGSCEDCEKGMYSVGQAAECTACHAGKYLDSKGSEGPCTSCPPGRYGDTNDNPFSEGAGRGFRSVLNCRRCPAGWSTNGNSGQLSCSICPSGKTSAPASSSSSNLNEECQDCAVGKYLSNTKYSPYRACGTNEHCPGECDTCPNGHVAPSAGMVECTKCDKGTYGGPSAADKQAACKACPQGWVAANDGDSQCIGCSAGQYIGAADDKYQCKSCATYHQSSGGANSVCKYCPKGWFVNSNKQGCSRCSAGTYQNEGGNSEGSTANRDVGACKTCSSAKYSALAATTCNYCGLGKFMTNTKKAWSGASNNHPCQNCDIGYKQGSTQNLNTHCDACGVTTSTTAAGATTCTTCNAANGKYSDTTGGACKTCPAGWYTSGGNAYRCGEGTFRLSSDSFTGCKLCPTGKHHKQGHPQALLNNDGSCRDCPAGKYTLNAVDCIPNPTAPPTPPLPSSGLYLDRGDSWHTPKTESNSGASAQCRCSDGTRQISMCATGCGNPEDVNWSCYTAPTVGNKHLGCLSSAKGCQNGASGSPSGVACTCSPSLYNVGGNPGKLFTYEQCMEECGRVNMYVISNQQEQGWATGTGCNTNGAKMWMCNFSGSGCGSRGSRPSGFGSDLEWKLACCAKNAETDFIKSDKNCNYATPSGYTACRVGQSAYTKSSSAQTISAAFSSCNGESTCKAVSCVKNSDDSTDQNNCYYHFGSIGSCPAGGTCSGPPVNKVIGGTYNDYWFWSKSSRL